MEDILAIIVIFGGGLTTVILLGWLRHRTIDARIKIQAELSKQLLDKFGSGREFAEFLDTESGKDFLQQLGSGERNPQEKLLKTVTNGVVVTFIGLATIVPSLWQRQLSGLTIPGVMILGAGVGTLIAAVISYRLSRKWGLIKEQGPNTANQIRG